MLDEKQPLKTAVAGSCFSPGSAGSSRPDEKSPLNAPATRAGSSQLRLAAVGFACCTGFIEGFDLCVISSILLPVQRSLELCYPCEGGDSTTALAECNCPQKAFAVSSIMLGAIFGGFSGGLVADRFGRLSAMLTANSCFLCGCLLMVAAVPSVAWSFFLGRVLVGFGVGVGGAASNSYLAEVVPDEQQARTVQLNEVVFCVGCLAAFFVAVLLGDGLWRATVAVGALPALVQLLAVSCLLPESPRWLALRGRADEARRVSEALGLRAPDPGEGEHPLMRRESTLGELAASQHTSSSFALISEHRRALLLAVGCAVGQAATGGSTVLYYSREVLEMAGYENALWGEALIGVLKLAGVLLALILVGRTGAKPLLVAGVLGQIAGHLMLAAAFGLVPGRSPWLALSGLLLYVLAWDLGWAGMMLVVAAAVLPSSVRGVGLGACWSCLWLCIFALSQSFGWAVDTLSVPGLFCTLVVTSLLSLVFVCMCVPEDAGLGHGGHAPAPSEQASEADAPAGTPHKRWRGPSSLHALLRTRSYGGVGALIGPYSEARAYADYRPGRR